MAATEVPILSSVPDAVDELEYAVTMEALQKAKATFYSLRLIQKLQQTSFGADKTLLVALATAGLAEKNLHQTIDQKVEAARAQVDVVSKALADLDHRISVRQALVPGEG